MGAVEPVASPLLEGPCGVEGAVGDDLFMPETTKPLTLSPPPPPPPPPPLPPLPAQVVPIDLTAEVVTPTFRETGRKGGVGVCGSFVTMSADECMRLPAT
mmetsp:Transcript_6453/g.11219  ORF Transcript_6453/g.11219 Transcript_6453/m.11219 type:complete len:100 (-) Transcript_6453:11-310(-)